jgi:hypothetical protein
MSGSERIARGYLLVGLFLLPAVGQAQEFTVLPIARAEIDFAPDGFVFNNIWSQSINDSGQVAFAAMTSGFISQLLLFDGGRLLQIARHGDPAPGGDNFGLFNYTWMNQLGQIAFSGILDSGGDGVFFFDGGKIIPISRADDGPTVCGPVRALVTPSLNDGGQIAFTVLVPAGYATFFYDGTQVVKIACPGDPAPGGGTFRRTAIPYVNNNGQVVFEAYLSSPSGTMSAILLYEQGDLRVVARSGDLLPSGETLGALTRPQINDAGQLAFFSDGVGLIVALDGEYRRFLPYENPETGERLRIDGPRGPRHPFSQNDAGQIVFEGWRAGAGEDFRRGMFFFDGADFRPIVYLGDLMPDPRGVRFQYFYSLVLSNTGQVSFVSDGYPRVEDNGLFLAVPNSP